MFLQRLALVASLLAVLVGCRQAKAPSAAPAPEKPPASWSLPFTPTAIGAKVEEFGRPMVTSLRLVDLDGDHLLDVLYCEAAKNTVRWIRQSPRGVFTEKTIGSDIRAPAHIWTADMYGRGRPDVLVACMGQITPNNDRIGSVVILENLGDGTFQPHRVAENMARVSDVRAANLSEHTDGRLDLVVGQFGYAQGETRWLQNLGDWRFADRIVNTQSGCIHTPVADFDGDGRPDFAALISQEWEEVHLFLNKKNAPFTDTVIWGSTNEDFGSSGLDTADVNRDGRPDLIYTNGDGFDYAEQGRRPWHGIQWIENRGNSDFAYHRVGDLPGAYSPVAADLDGDGTTDLLAVSAFADWDDPGAVSMMAWMNNGHQSFTPVVLARRPSHLITAAVGDLDGTGKPVIVTGGFHAYPPFEHMSTITLWRRP